MNEQFIFYWLSWFFVIIIYFFVEHRNTKRFFLIVIFLSIIFINHTIMLYPYITISISFMIILLASLIYFLQMPLYMYDLFVTITIIFTYVALLLWGKAAPIWFVVHPFILIPLIISVFILILHENLRKQIAIASFSITVGQLIYSFILVQYQLQSNLNKTFFIYLYITLLLLLFTHLATSLIYFIKRNLSKLNL